MSVEDILYGISESHTICHVYRLAFQTNSINLTWHLDKHCLLLESQLKHIRIYKPRLEAILLTDLLAIFEQELLPFQ